MSKEEMKRIAILHHMKRAQTLLGKKNRTPMEFQMLKQSQDFLRNPDAHGLNWVPLLNREYVKELKQA